MNKRKNFTLSHRLLHWSIALTILFILLTLFLRDTWMDKNHMANIISTSLSSYDISLSKEMAIKVAKSIRRSMFEWHIYAGYVLVALVIFRLIHIKNAGVNYKGPFNKESTIKEKLQAYVYISFYIGLILVSITGLLIKFGPDSVNDFAKDIHGIALWYFIPFLIIHFAGIFIGESGEEKGVVSKMIGG